MQEYKGIASRRLAVLKASQPQSKHFTILVRGIPLTNEHSLSETVKLFFHSVPSFDLSFTSNDLSNWQSAGTYGEPFFEFVLYF